MNEEIIRMLTCPITFEIFNEPITLSDGHTYEKNAVLNIFKNNINVVVFSRFFRDAGDA